jgi:sortase A
LAGGGDKWVRRPWGNGAPNSSQARRRANRPARGGPSARWRGGAERTVAGRPFRIVGVVCLALGVVPMAMLAWFYVHNSTGAAALLSQAQQRIDSTGSAVGCTPSQGAVAELVIPSIAVVAPVVEGDGDAQLADAVGHVPATVWPGGDGTPVFVAHDVTWFHGLGHLRRGAEIEYVSHCRAEVYRVASAKVVAKGTPVVNSPRSLALVTCWPLDALWFTSRRLLVTAEAAGGTTRVPAVRATEAQPAPLVSVPASLVGVDTLASNPAPLGTLTVSGTPTATYMSSPGPLADLVAAQEVYFAGLRAAAAADTGQWSSLAPGVPLSAATPLEGSTLTGYAQPLATNLNVRGDRVTGAVLTASFDVARTQWAGRWTVHVTEGLVAGKLAVTGWSMSGA